MKIFRPKPNFETLKRQLLDVISILDANDIRYHLEGGTLLGIVRDGMLLPWDHDTDISIMHDDLVRFLSLLPALKKSGWRISVRRLEKDCSFGKEGQVRLIKVKDRFLGLIAGENVLDIFVKFRKDDDVYWVAKNNTMKVANVHYNGFDEIMWEGKKLKAPHQHKEYLTSKYGEWNTIIKEWDCTMEHTIVRD